MTARYPVESIRNMIWNTYNSNPDADKVEYWQAILKGLGVAVDASPENKERGEDGDYSYEWDGQELTLTKYKGTDPEAFSAWIAQAGMTSAPSGMSGIDENAIPVPRTYTLGLKLNF